MKSKLLLGALSLMVAAGGLVGCGAMNEVKEEAKDMISPSASASAAADASVAPGNTAGGGMDIGAAESAPASAMPSAPASAMPSASAAAGAQ